MIEKGILIVNKLRHLLSLEYIYFSSVILGNILF